MSRNPYTLDKHGRLLKGKYQRGINWWLWALALLTASAVVTAVGYLLWSSLSLLSLLVLLMALGWGW